MAYLISRLIHLVAVLVLAGALILQNMAIAAKISPEDARNLARINKFYAMAAAVILIVGLVLWLAVGKPAAFYSANPVFHTKLTLFVLLGGLAVVPTRFFRQQAKSGDTQIEVPVAVRVVLRLELVLLVITLVLAWLMAQGIGLSA